MRRHRAGARRRSPIGTPVRPGLMRAWRPALCLEPTYSSADGLSCVFPVHVHTAAVRRKADMLHRADTGWCPSTLVCNASSCVDTSQPTSHYRSPVQYTELPDNLLQTTADYQEAPLLNPPATKRRDALQVAVAHPRSLQYATECRVPCMSQRAATCRT